MGPCMNFSQSWAFQRCKIGGLKDPSWIGMEIEAFATSILVPCVSFSLSCVPLLNVPSTDLECLGSVGGC